MKRITLTLDSRQKVTTDAAARVYGTKIRPTYVARTGLLGIRSQPTPARYPAHLGIDELFSRPYLTITIAATLLDVTFRSASLNVRKLVDAGMLEELPGRTYGRIFRAREILNALEATIPQPEHERISKDVEP